MRKVILMIFSILMFVTGCETYEYRDLYVLGDVFALSDACRERVEAHMVNVDDFEAKRIGDDDWVGCECEYPYVNVFVLENTGNDPREAHIEVFNSKHNLRDTILVYQYGAPKNYDNTGNNNGGGSNWTGGGGSTVSRRCAAITKKGTRCKRTASKGSIYCWQHKR